MNNSKNVFISYSRSNLDLAIKISEELKTNGVNVWIDQDIRSLPPGVEWRSHIENSIQQCDIFIALLSEESITKRGFVNKELKIALDIIDEFPDNQVFILPVRVNNCTPINIKLRNLTWIDLFPDWDDGIEKILLTINENLTKEKIKKEPTKKELKLFIGSFSETYINKFEKVSKKKITYNIPALILGPIWCAYRKMYICAFGIFFIMMILAVFVYDPLILLFFPNIKEDESIAIHSLINGVSMMLLSDRLYNRYVTKKILKIRKKSSIDYMERNLINKGGVSYIVLLILSILVLLGVYLSLKTLTS